MVQRLKHMPEHLRGRLEYYSQFTAARSWVISCLKELTPEKTAGLRKLLEAKDCFVRAKLEADDPPDTRN